MMVAFGVAETMQMLQFREQVKSQLSPEEYLDNMAVHKASIQAVINQVPELPPVVAAEYLVNMLDADLSLSADQREVWKAMVVIAAFEMTEF